MAPAISSRRYLAILDRSSIITLVSHEDSVVKIHRGKLKSQASHCLSEPLFHARLSTTKDPREPFSPRNSAEDSLHPFTQHSVSRTVSTDRKSLIKADLITSYLNFKPETLKHPSRNSFVPRSLKNSKRSMKRKTTRSRLTRHVNFKRIFKGSRAKCMSN